jgi:histidine phosphotransferase ChpT
MAAVTNGASSMKSHEFASLLCSRLCHDLLSPVGALNNGIELLSDEHDPEMRARCLDLLGESARASANKLKFFRLAFGAAGGFADEVDTREARVAIEGLFGGDGRITLGWMVDMPTLSKSALKVLLNLVLIAGDALVRGGRLDVGAERHDSGLDIVARAEGPRIVLDAELKRALAGEASEEAIAPRAAAAWLVHCLVDEGGGEVQINDQEEGVLLLGAALPRG